MLKTKNKVFLGGTCNDSTWRDIFIKLINNRVDYFNPVVDNWNEEAFQRELKEKEICDYQLYTITPRMTGVYSIAEIIDCSNKTPHKAIFCVMKEDGGDRFDDAQLRSLSKVGEMVIDNGGSYFTSLEDVARYLIGAN